MERKEGVKKEQTKEEILIMASYLKKNRNQISSNSSTVYVF